MNKTRLKLAKELNIHPETLAKFLTSMGFQKRKSFTTEEFKAISKLVTNQLYFQVTRKKLAKLYGIHTDTLKRFLKEAGIAHNKKLTIPELKKLYELVGLPIDEDYLSRK